MKKKKSIAKNFTFNLIYQLLTLLLPLITTPYISRILGAEPIGVYGYTVSIVTYFILFGTLGISMYGQREIAKCDDDIDKRTCSFYEIVLIRLCSLTASMLIFYLCFCTKGEYLIYYRILLIQMIANLFDISWLFQGVEDFDKTVVRNIIVKILSIVLIFTLVKQANDLWLYYVIFVGSELIGNISLWFYLPKYLKKIEVGKLKFKKHLLPTLALFIPQVAIQIYTVLDKTMIGMITNDMSMVGFYEQAQKVVRAALVIVASLQIVMNSRVANAYSKNDNEEIKNCLDKSFDFVWFLGIPLMFGLIATAKNLVPWYYGAGYEPIISIIISISPIVVAVGLNGITGIVYLIQTGKQTAFTISVVIGAIVNIILNSILISIYGGAGAAVASAIAETIIFLCHLPIIRKEYKISKIFNKAIKPLIIGTIMCFIVSYVSNKFTPTAFHTLILVLIGAIVYFMGLLIVRYDFIYKIINQIYEFVKVKVKKHD